jgi:hypothetical protein
MPTSMVNTMSKLRHSILLLLFVCDFFCLVFFELPEPVVRYLPLLLEYCQLSVLSSFSSLISNVSTDILDFAFVPWFAVVWTVLSSCIIFAFQFGKISVLSSD